jgi:hypothetical protein
LGLESTTNVEFSSIVDKKKVNNDDDEDRRERASEQEIRRNFEYLLNGGFESKTARLKLIQRSEEKKRKLSEMKQKSPRDLWKADLINFLDAFDKLERKEESLVKVEINSIKYTRTCG